MKIKFLIFAALTVFLTAGTAFTQFDNGGMGMGFDPTQFGITKEKIEELMNTPTGEITTEIDAELMARIEVCHEKGTPVSEEEFNTLKAPYDVTALEFAAYNWQRLSIWAKEGMDEQKYQKYKSTYESRVAELKANGCKFETKPEPPTKPGCYDNDGDNPNRKTDVYFYGTSTPTVYCNPCKYEDECSGKNVIERVCKKDNKTCKDGCVDEKIHECEYGCFAGRCLTKEESTKQLCEGQCLEKCPAGTMDFGEGGCPKQVKLCGYQNDKWVCEYYPQAKCCKKNFDTSIPTNGSCQGICMNAVECPEGYEKQGTDSCVQEESCYKCGPFRWFTCCNYTAKLCCLPKEGVKEPPTPEKCNGYCSIGNVCPSNAINKGLADCQSKQQCRSCGFFGLKKCCEYLPTTCCEYPKPVTDCSAGVCTYNDCPEGTQDVGLANCGKVKDCETCYWVAKCCKKKQTKCCMALNYTKCTGGICQNGDICPEGFKKTGIADCGYYEKEHSCGFLGMGKCKDPAPKTCCMPE